MVTSKNRVQAYLSDEVYDSLVEYSQSHNLSFSSAIDQLLFLAFNSGVDRPLNEHDLSCFKAHTERRFKTIDARLLSLEKNVKKLDNLSDLSPY